MKKVRILIVAFSLIANVVCAQKISWNPTVKINGGFFQHHLGSSGGKSYSLLSKFTIKKDIREGNAHGAIKWEKDNKIQLAIFDGQHSHLNTVEVEFGKEPEKFLNGLVTGDKIYLLYTSTENKEETNLLVDEFSTEGQRLNTRSLASVGWPDFLAADEAKQVFAIKYIHKGSGSDQPETQRVMILDNTFKEIKSMPCGRDLISSKFYDGGKKLLLLASSDEKLFTAALDIQTGKLTEKEVNLPESMTTSFRLAIDETNNAGYVFWLSGVANEKNDDDFYSQGYNVSQFDLITLVEKASKKGQFTDATLVAFNKVKSRDKVKNNGLEMARAIQVTATGKDEIVVVLEKHYMMSVSSSSSTQFHSFHENMLLLKIDLNGEVSEKIFERELSANVRTGHYLLAKFFALGDKHYLVTYEKDGMRPTLLIHRLDKDMNIVNTLKQDTWKESKTYLDLSDPVITKDNRIFMLSNFLGQFSSAYID